MSDTPAQDCFDEPCKHCGSTKGFWFSRSEPMGYFCEECGMPDNKELLEQPAKMNEIKEKKEEDMSELFKLKPCEECNGTGIALIEKHDCDCPDCLGTGYEEPAKRIMNLELMLNQHKETLKSSDAHNNELAQQLEIAWEQRDRLAEAIITHRAKAFPLNGEDYDLELWQSITETKGGDQ
jgi:RecJ-like exonuclease